MGRSLTPSQLCKIYDLAYIEEKITYWQDLLESAAVKMYDKDTTQGRQKVESADLKDIEEQLALWVGAKLCKTGQRGPNIASVNFQGTGRGGL